MKKVFIVLLAAGAFIVGSGPLYADEPLASSCISTGTCNDWKDKPISALDLSPEQKNKIDQIIQEKRNVIRPMREQLHQDRQTMQALMASNSVDQSELRQLAREQVNRRVDMNMARLETRNQIEAVLTPAQKHQWQHQRQNRYENRYNHTYSSQRNGGRGKKR